MKLPFSSLNIKGDGFSSNNPKNHNKLLKVIFIPWKECLSTITEPRVVLQMTTSPTGDAFITAGNNQLIHIYSIHTLQKIMTCEPSATNDIMDGHKSSGIDSHRITTLVKMSPFRFFIKYMHSSTIRMIFGILYPLGGTIQYNFGTVERDDQTEKYLDLIFVDRPLILILLKIQFWWVQVQIF